MGETVLVGDNIRLTVIGIRGDRVRLGIVAPEDVVVDRKEIHDQRLNMHDNAIPAPQVPLRLAPVAVVNEAAIQNQQCVPDLDRFSAGELHGPATWRQQPETNRLSVALHGPRRPGGGKP